LLALDLIQKHNEGLAAATPDAASGQDIEVPVFQLVGNVDYPRDADGELLGLIHPEVQGKDFTEIKDGDPAFLMHDKSVKPFESAKFGDDAKAPLYTFFVNEAAYYEKKMAFMVARKVQRKVHVPSWLAEHIC